MLYPAELLGLILAAAPLFLSIYSESLTACQFRTGCVSGCGIDSHDEPQLARPGFAHYYGVDEQNAAGNICMKRKSVPILATTTTATTEDARKIAAALVEERLAACVQIIEPITSVYRWQGAVEEEKEILLLIKSSKDLVPRIAELLDRIHPYEVPELIAVPIIEGSSAYLSWLDENLQ